MAASMQLGSMTAEPFLHCGSQSAAGQASALAVLGSGRVCRSRRTRSSSCQGPRFGRMGSGVYACKGAGASGEQAGMDRRGGSGGPGNAGQGNSGTGPAGADSAAQRRERKGILATNPLEAASVAASRLQAKLVAIMNQQSVETGAQGAVSDMHAVEGWSEWSRIFQAVELQATKLETLKAQLDEAVAEERYGDAAVFRKMLDSYVASDPVAGVTERLKVALEEERYEDAAKLRDEGGAGLIGWWVGQAADSSTADPFGHIIKITPHQGRYVGTKYTARALSDKQPGRSIMEIFVTEDGKGSFQQRPCFLESAEATAAALPADDESVTGRLRPSIEVEISQGSRAITLDSMTLRDDDEEDMMAERMGHADEDSGEVTGADYGRMQVRRDGTYYTLPKRVPARIEWNGRNSFSFTIEREDSGSRASSSVRPGDMTSGVSRVGRRRSSSSNVDMNGKGKGRRTGKLSDPDAEVIVAAANEVESAAEKMMGAFAAKVVGESLRSAAMFRSSSASTLQPKTVFRRLMNGKKNSDPLTGLYVGAFGPHGPELLQLQRGAFTDDVDEFFSDDCDPEDCVSAVKLTGDLNVPAGLVSFRAQTGKSMRLPHRGVYPDELGVVARYRGQGRAAQPGFENAQWVEGELLVLDGRGGDITGGAELGFVWAVPGQRRFLVLFNRVTLDD